MAFIETRLPDRVASGFRGGPEWSTLIVPMDNGREQRNAQWLYPKHRYTAQYGLFNEADRLSVLNAFHAMRGRLHCFPMKDHNDSYAASEVIMPVAGTMTPVQLIKTYTHGGQTSTRLIQCVSTDAVVYRNGVAVAGTMATSTGLFTPDSNWSGTGTFTWTGNFYVWVRFDSDYNSFSTIHSQVRTADIELIEVRR